MEPVPGLPLVAMGSLLVIFSSGIYLAIRMSAFGLAWPKAAVGALLLIAPLGALTARRMRAIRQTSTGATTITSELIDRLQDPFLKISLGIRIAVSLAIVQSPGNHKEIEDREGAVNLREVSLLAATPPRRIPEVS